MTLKLFLTVRMITLKKLVRKSISPLLLKRPTPIPYFHPYFTIYRIPRHSEGAYLHKKMQTNLYNNIKGVNKSLQQYQWI